VVISAPDRLPDVPPTKPAVEETAGQATTHHVAESRLNNPASQCVSALQLRLTQMKFLYCQDARSNPPTKSIGQRAAYLLLRRYAAWFEERRHNYVGIRPDPQSASGGGDRHRIHNALFLDPYSAQTGQQIAALLASQRDDDRFKVEGSLILCAPPSCEVLERDGQTLLPGTAQR